MFEKILQELRQLQGTQNFSVPINSDKDGYTDKECPDTKCMFEFKVHEEDWRDLFNDEKVFCPMCRHEANAKSWFTTAQIEGAKQKALEYYQGRINNALHEDASNYNAKQPRNSFLKMSMKFTGSRGTGYILPLAAKEEMELKIKCKECRARYAVIGSGFFCPCCGHNSAEETLDNALKKIETKMANLELIRTSLLSVSKDTAEITCRFLIETSLSDCVVAFQRFCEETFRKKYPTIKVYRNAFQNLDTGANLWQQHLGKSYPDWISSQEFSELQILFQKRHLFAHTEGIVDQDYIDNSTDKSYKLGQRIVLLHQDVVHCSELVKKIIVGLKSQL